MILKEASFPASCAIGLRSLGPQNPTFPLLPVLSQGCPVTSTEAVSYPLAVDYDYSRVNPQSLIQAPLPGLDRWQPLLPPLAPGLSMGEGGTPLLRMTGLDGTPLWLKDESRNPTGSHKDRLNLCAVSAAVASGAPGVAVASSGNHGVSAAAYAARAGLPCVVLTSPELSAAFAAALHAYGAWVVAVPTAARWPLLRAVVADTGFQPMSNLTRHHTGHPWGPEGYKTLAFELFQQWGGRLPGAVVIPTGYAELLYGVYCGFVELQRLGLSTHVPRLYAAEPAAGAPLAHAMAQGTPVAEVSTGPTRQLSIACSVSGYRGVLALQGSGGRALRVDDDRVAQARDHAARAGLWLEFSAAAGVAAVAQLTPKEQEGGVVVVATARGVNDPLPPQDLPSVAPTFAALRDYVRTTYGVSLPQQG